MGSQPAPADTAYPTDPARPVGAAHPGPPPGDPGVRWVYQPVEVHFADGDWALGRISAWWDGPHGDRWCRLRIARSGGAARWEPFEPARMVLLPSGGI
ncbi:hypothetical protein [Kitasatospora sp. NPDC094015]|uniref:hypothetical protein n=1 Tax=Kitasatospora sp. NPDC094015 TaxID=3155205 RepID=UPI00331E2CC3